MCDDCLFGLGKEGEAIDFYPYEAFRKELTIRASYVNPHTMERAVRLLSSNQFSASMFISKEIQLEEAEVELRTQRIQDTESSGTHFLIEVATLMKSIGMAAVYE